MAFVTDSTRPQPLWQPLPTAYRTGSGTAFEVPPHLVRRARPTPGEGDRCGLHWWTATRVPQHGPGAKRRLLPYGSFMS